jgi:predicted phage baseplate assembly protein
MALPQIVLDDRTFQELVNEARLRINRVCPEWTEHNVSDPGITLIELFAWMTDMLVYRINRIPDKLHVALLELVGIRLNPPSCATTDVRFRLAAPPAEALTIPAGETEIATVRTASDESIVFQTTDDFTIPAIAPVAYVVERGGQAQSVKVAGGHARPTGSDQFPFGKQPAVDDALYLGFDSPIDRLIIRVDVECSPARGAGVDPDDPPLRWEMSGPHGEWHEAEVLEDTTGGFNYGSGAIEVVLGQPSAVVALAGHRCRWLRCQLKDRTRAGSTTALFQQPPAIYDISASIIGAEISAAHAAREREELIGESDGTPGQSFRLRHPRVMTLAPGERLEVSDPGATAWQPWEERDSFVGSSDTDPHFRLDRLMGEIELGPSIRQADGRWTQYGATPPKGATLRISGYRHGGGREGNVAVDALTVLRSAIPGVASVTNPAPARGGVDAETLDSARHRAAMEIRSRHRAVTAQDFEYLCRKASPQIARVRVQPGEGHAIGVHIIPRVDPADRQLSLDELTPKKDLLAETAAYLNEYRLVGTTVHLLPASFRGVSVVVNLQATALSDPERVERDVEHALYIYLNPILGGSPAGPGGGWPFGRTLNTGELYGIVHSIQGVQQISFLRVYETDLVTREQSSKPVGSHIELGPTELIASADHIVQASHRPGV